MSIHINHPTKSGFGKNKLPPIVPTDISKDFELCNKKVEYMRNYKSYKILAPISPTNYKAPLPEGQDYRFS